MDVVITCWYVCTCAYGCYVLMYMYILRLDVNVRCLPIFLLFLFLKIVFNHEPENHQFAYTRGPVSSRDLAVSLLPTLYFLPISRVAEFYLDMAFIWLQVTGTQVLMIMQ